MNEFRDRVVYMQRRIRENNCYTIDSYLSSLGTEAGDFIDNATIVSYDEQPKNSSVSNDTLVCYRVYNPNNNSIDSFLREMTARNCMYNIVLYAVQGNTNKNNAFKEICKACKDHDSEMVFVAVPYYSNDDEHIQNSVREGMDLLNYEIRDRPSKRTLYMETPKTYTEKTNQLIENNDITIDKYLQQSSFK